MPSPRLLYSSFHSAPEYQSRCPFVNVVGGVVRRGGSRRLSPRADAHCEYMTCTREQCLLLQAAEYPPLKSESLKIRDLRRKTAGFPRTGAGRGNETEKNRQPGERRSTSAGKSRQAGTSAPKRSCCMASAYHDNRRPAKMAPPSVAPRAKVYSSTGRQQRANSNGNSARPGFQRTRHAVPSRTRLAV